MINDNRDLQVQRETENVIVISLLSQSRNKDYSNNFCFFLVPQKQQIIYSHDTILDQFIMLLMSRFHEIFSRKITKIISHLQIIINNGCVNNDNAATR